VIVKVQVPLASNDPIAPALIYAEGRRHMQTIPVHRLPKDVLAAALPTGKTYFYAQMLGGRVRFHKQAKDQDW
jgi:hypothetical protein